MILKRIEDNDLIDCILIMKSSTIDVDFVGYSENQRAWITYFAGLIKQSQTTPNIIVHGIFEDNKLLGFMSAATFESYYDEKVIMDVKDCIVDESLSQLKKAKTVAKLFDNMIEHTKKHGGKNWRADSIRPYDESFKYAEFLRKRYGCAIHFSARGVINENK